MNHSPDNRDVSSELDDEAIEALLRGEASTPDIQPLADAVKALHDGPYPAVQPSPELARRMATDDFATSEQRNRIRNTTSWLPSSRARTKIAIGITAVLLSITALAAAGALPDAAQQRVEKIIDTVTRIDITGNGSSGGSSIDGDTSDSTSTDSGSTSAEDRSRPRTDKREETEGREKNKDGAGDNRHDTHQDSEKPDKPGDPGRSDRADNDRRKEDEPQGPPTTPQPEPAATPTDKPAVQLTRGANRPGRAGNRTQKPSNDHGITH